MISIEYFFILSGLLFFIGVFGFITRRNLVAMLISVELVLNAVDLNFAAWLLSSMFTVISTATR